MFYFPNGAIVEFDETEKLAVLTLIFDSLPLLMDSFKLLNMWTCYDHHITA